MKKGKERGRRRFQYRFSNYRGWHQGNVSKLPVRRTQFLPSYLPSSLEISQVSHRGNCRDPLSTPILISRIPSSAKRGAPILPRDRRRCVYHTPRADACAETRPLVITLESTTRYVYPRRLRGTRGNLCEYAVVTQKARNGSVFPGPGLFVLYVRSAPCCVYLGPPISPQSGIFSQMRRLEQTPLRLSIKADSLMWTTMKRFGPTPAPVLAFVVTLPIFLSLTFVPSIYRLLFHYLTTSCGNHATGQGIFRSCIWSTRFHSRRSPNRGSRINICCLFSTI